MKIGFIGQGWIGKNYANDFENRGFNVVRYALEEPYASNKALLAGCDIVFIAVPTPTTQDGFNRKIVENVLPLVGNGKIAVIKSTLIPGTTKELSLLFPNIHVLHSPEFLTEATAKEDAERPTRNIVGIPFETETYTEVAKKVLAVLPNSPFNQVCLSDEAEIIKYAHNIHGYIQVVFSNILFDLSSKYDSRWEELKRAFIADPMMCHTYLNPIHKSGRGAGGDCFIKDFKAFLTVYERTVGDVAAINVLKALELKNNELLVSTNKDLDLLQGVYGSVSGKMVLSKDVQFKIKKLYEL